MPHIFDRFYRVDKARTKNNISGYGLGLSIAKHIVDLHHGTISLKSTPQKGTTFFITLPKS
jgi:two-component system phosphate regulon sensor histidine kinase PhoR